MQFKGREIVISPEAIEIWADQSSVTFAETYRRWQEFRTKHKDELAEIHRKAWGEYLIEPLPIEHEGAD